MTIEDLSRVMARNVRTYSLIDHIMKIYELMDKMEDVHQKSLVARELSSFKILDQKLCQRLIALIKGMVKDHPIMPVGFQFKGKCALADAQKKLKKNLMENSMAS